MASVGYIPAAWFFLDWSICIWFDYMDPVFGSASRDPRKAWTKFFFLMSDSCWFSGRVKHKHTHGRFVHRG